MLSPSQSLCSVLVVGGCVFSTMIKIEQVSHPIWLSVWRRPAPFVAKCRVFVVNDITTISLRKGPQFCKLTARKWTCSLLALVWGGSIGPDTLNTHFSSFFFKKTTFFEFVWRPYTGSVSVFQLTAALFVRKYFFFSLSLQYKPCCFIIPFFVYITIYHF